MRNTRYVKWVWICTFMVMMSCQVGRAVAQSAANVQPKDNPFESVLKKQQYASTQGGEMLDEYDFSDGVRGRFYKPTKVPTTMRLDNDVLLFLKKQASEKKIAYQTLINNLLRDYMQEGMKKSY